jgi:hypothetical protein
MGVDDSVEWVGGNGNKFGEVRYQVSYGRRGKRECIDDQLSEPGRGRENASENICISRGPSMSSTRLTATAQANGLMPSWGMFPPSGGSDRQGPLQAF